MKIRKIIVGALVLVVGLPLVVMLIAIVYGRCRSVRGNHMQQAV